MALVYPRACGGTHAERTTQLQRVGLSPRVRGNLPSCNVVGPIGGSIPARAGEPTGGPSNAGPDGVYPRACGGTPGAGDAGNPHRGLSPRVRGNQCSGAGRRWSAGSIPARAGEPTRLREHRFQRRVYPRACGGTTPSLNVPFSVSGLSPRVRGNQRLYQGPGVAARSIPARAGEPPSGLVQFTICRVYPRACGGTERHGITSSGLRGLSPRVRGNRDDARIRAAAKGSIPARAGEPFGGAMYQRVVKVYPRACGGTVFTAIGVAADTGLSPRVRGNHPHHHVQGVIFQGL